MPIIKYDRDASKPPENLHVTRQLVLRGRTFPVRSPLESAFSGLLAQQFFPRVYQRGLPVTPKLDSMLPARTRANAK